MCGCSSEKNQTTEEVHSYFTDQLNRRSGFDHRDDVGTGVFLVPDPESGILEEKKVLVRDISYKETVKRGHNCIAFSFVPNAIKSFDEIHAMKCITNCTSASKCVTGCGCGGFGCY